MKIGILTFHNAHNYGAVLQAYSLQEYLRSLKHDVYIVDYRPHYVSSEYPKYFWGISKGAGFMQNVKNLSMELLKVGRRVRRYNAFNNFIHDKMHLYPFSKTEDLNFFDVIVIGSDQVWNPKITGGKFDDIFFGKGVKTKVITYAASSRFLELTNREADFFHENLKNISHIGVREKRLVDILSPLTDKVINLNLDPTLLRKESDWSGLNLSRPVRRNFVMIYEITEHDYVQKIAEDIANKCNSKVVRLIAYLRTKIDKNKDEVASPEKFVSYIKYAECVVTTSFHGVALSIIFKKKFFYVLQNRDADDRIISLLSLLNLSNRIIQRDGHADINETIDWDQAYAMLEKERTKSVEYLVSALLN